MLRGILKYGIILILLVSSRLLAQEKPLIEVNSMVDTSVITIGGRINYSIIIDRDEKLQIAKPGEGLNLGMFEIKSYNFEKPRHEDGRIIERYDFNISVYDTGRYTIPPFPVAYFEGDSAKTSIIEAPPIDIYVKSVLSGDEKPELKDIKPPLEIPFNYKFWISMAIIVLILLVIAWLAYKAWKRRKERGYLFTPPPPPKPAHVVALSALRQLYESDLLARGMIKAFFIEISMIIRTYLEGRYYISALEETSSEIIAELKYRITEDGQIELLKYLLPLADLVKFAKHIPETDEIEKAKQSALDFVNKTKIVYEAETPEEGPAENETAAVLPENTIGSTEKKVQN